MYFDSDKNPKVQLFGVKNCSGDIYLQPDMKNTSRFLALTMSAAFEHMSLVK